MRKIKTYRYETERKKGEGREETVNEGWWVR